MVKCEYEGLLIFVSLSFTVNALYVFFRHWHWPIPSLTDRSENCRMHTFVRVSLHIINK